MIIQDDDGTQPAEAATTRSAGQHSAAGLVALVAFAWGMSLLVAEWLRITWFEPRDISVSVLAAPFFALAVAASLVGVHARVTGRPSVGGSIVHRFGLASGLVGATALVLSLYMGPRLLQLQSEARLGRARLELEEIVAALEAHAEDAGAYPEGAGARALDPLAPHFGSRRVPARDPWGHELEYRSLASGRGYLLLSLGPDGQADLPLSGYLEGPPRHGGDDIVVVNGSFRGQANAPTEWPRLPDGESLPSGPLDTNAVAPAEALPSPSVSHPAGPSAAPDAGGTQ